MVYVFCQGYNKARNVNNAYVLLQIPKYRRWQLCGTVTSECDNLKQNHVKTVQISWKSDLYFWYTLCIGRKSVNQL